MAAHGYTVFSETWIPGALAFSPIRSTALTIWGLQFISRHCRQAGGTVHESAPIERLNRPSFAEKKASRPKLRSALGRSRSRKVRPLELAYPRKTPIWQFSIHPAVPLYWCCTPTDKTAQSLQQCTVVTRPHTLPRVGATARGDRTI